MNISHVLAVMPVSDHDVATGWYEKLLGRPADNRPMPPLADWHVTDSGWLQVFHDPTRAGSSSVNFAVDSVDDARDTLRRRGLAPGEPFEASAGVRLLQIDDPDGNTVTLVENLR